MYTFTHTVRDEAGIHARPAGLLVNRVKELGVPVKLTFGEKTADAARLFSVMSLGLKCGDKVTVTVDGGDDAGRQLEAFFAETL